MRKITLKKALELFGATNIEIHRGYYYCSGFYDKDGHTEYFSSSDVRCGPLTILTRTAEDRKDYTGGQNEYVFIPFLKERGYYLSSIPHKT